MNEQDDRKAFLAILGIVAAVVIVVGSVGGWPAPAGTGEAAWGTYGSSFEAGLENGDGQKGDNASSTVEEPFQPSAEHQKLLDSIDEDAVRASLDSDLADALLEHAQTDEDSAWVAAHINDDAYYVDGEAVRGKLLKLAAKEVEATAFVRGFPEKYPAEVGEPMDASENGVSAASSDASQGGEVGNGAIKDQDGSSASGVTTSAPRLYQWDTRWGYTKYSSTAFALTGCCPTSMAMVYQGLTGDTSKTPYDMGVLASKGGYETTYDGTDMAFLYGGASELGMTCREIDESASAIKQVLDAGGLIIDNVGKGDFTENGHYLVICGIEGDELIINDPYSAENSQKRWDVDRVLGQTKALYAFNLA